MIAGPSACVSCLSPAIVRFRLSRRLARVGARYRDDMSTQWNDEEDAAMDYLPHVDQVIYLRGIRRRMNYQTGITGLSAPISYAWLGQLTDVHPEIGSNAAPKARMTLSAIRCSLARLERAGLIERIPNSDRRLVFRCILASRDQSVSGRNSRGTAEEQQTRNNTVFETENNELHKKNSIGAADCCTAMNSTLQGSGIRVLRGAKAPVEPALGGPDLVPSDHAKNTPINGATKPVRMVFEYWQQVMNHPQAILDNKRSRAIAGRLKEGHSVDKLKLAIDGCKASPWHQGKNDRHQVFDDIELICRDAKRVESFIARVAGQTAQQAELDAWVNEGACLEGEYHHVQA